MKIIKKSVISLFVLTICASIIAQTAIKVPKNKYKIEDDIKIGRQAAQEVESKMPILRDAEVTRYVQYVGDRLVRAIPPELQKPQFRYTFKVVDASDINAFALPGGPMYINRGVIEVARNEGELAGVMAHEISHVVLRHATAQATKMNNPLNQILAIGSVLGGAILGGDLGAQLGQLAVAGYFLRYSREYETQADILGAQIMARAGYDPNDLANMFRTIEQEGRSRGSGKPPEWLSSHPDPGNRYERIRTETRYLSVSKNPTKVTPEFLRVQQKLRSMPPARSLEDIQRGNRNSKIYNGRYERNVPLPSSRTATYYNNGIFSVNVPVNWEVVEESNNEVWFAPRGAYGKEGITHGAIIGISATSGQDLRRETQTFVNDLLRNNDYLRQRESFRRTTLLNREALSTLLEGRSPITKRIEIVNIFTTLLRDGNLFYVITVVPEDERTDYEQAFSRMLASIRLNSR